MRFVNINPATNTDKFWTFDVLSTYRVAFAWGRRGAAGQSKTVTYDTPTRLTRELERLVQEKLSKGYRPVDEATGAPARNLEQFGIELQMLNERERLAKMAERQGRDQLIAFIQAQEPRQLIAFIQAQEPRPGLEAVRQRAKREAEEAGGPSAAPSRAILVAMKTKRRITFE